MVVRDDGLVQGFSMRDDRGMTSPLNESERLGWPIGDARRRTTGSSTFHQGARASQGLGECVSIPEHIDTRHEFRSKGPRMAVRY